MIELALVLLFSAIYGLNEAYIYSRGFVGGNYIIYKLSWYHILSISLFLTFLLGGFGIHALKYLPLCALIEDIYYWVGMDRFDQHETCIAETELTKDSWVNHGLSGFKLFGSWIPTAYILGIVGYTILEILF